MLYLKDSDVKQAKKDGAGALLQMLQENNMRIAVIFACMKNADKIEGLEPAQICRCLSDVGMATVNLTFDLMDKLNEASEK